MLYAVKEFCLKLPDTRLDCIAFGTGTKPLVMLQGLNTHSIKGAGLSLAYMYRMFAKEYRVYLFDRRPDAQPGITVRQMAADVAAAMDALGLADADVLGVSQGGMIGQYLAIDRPELVRRMVLAVTLARSNGTVCAVIRNWVAMAQQGAMKALVADMAEKMYSDAYLKRYRPLLPLLTVLQKPRDVRRFVTLAESCLTCNAYEQLHSIRCPVLVLGGRQDKVVGADACTELAQKLGCECFVYETLGHAAYEEAADFNRRVYEFLNQ